MYILQDIRENEKLQRKRNEKEERRIPVKKTKISKKEG